MVPGHLSYIIKRNSSTTEKCGTIAYSSPTPRSTPSSPPFVPGDLPANPDEVYMVWLHGVMPSEREEAAIVEYTRRLESGEEVQ